MLYSGLRLGGRYRLDARIGAGGMGEVWRAVDDVLGRVVAVKAMLPEVAGEPGFAKRFLVEAKAMASVNHHAVASIHDYGHSDGITFLVMEFIDGESLSQVLGRVGRLPAAVVMRLVAQAADGLQAVHDCGIVHRDIKPANLLVRRNGSLLITDFGISRTEGGTQLTASGAMLGTPTYLSPEQVLGQPVTARSDVYSLGLVAYECLAGRRPFEGENPFAVALQRIQTAPRTLGGDIPPPVLAVVAGALATDPAQRLPSAAALADAARATVSATDAAAGRRRDVGPPAAGPASNLGPATAGPGPSFGAWHPGPASGSGSRPAGSVVQHGPPPPAPTAPRTRRRSVIVAVLVAAVVAGLVAWTVNRDTGRDDVSAGETDPTSSSSAPSSTASSTTAPPDVLFEQAGLTACDDLFCPATPMCWGGLTSFSGRTESPRPVDCAELHYWETFAAVEPPPDVATSSEDTLMERPEVAQTCSAEAMSSRSSDPSSTAAWDRDAWLIEVPGTDARLLHCLASAVEGESTGSVFTP